jgi:hypothetical protein
LWDIPIDATASRFKGVPCCSSPYKDSTNLHSRSQFVTENNDAQGKTSEFPEIENDGDCQGSGNRRKPIDSSYTEILRCDIDEEKEQMTGNNERKWEEFCDYMWNVDGW